MAGDLKRQNCLRKNHYAAAVNEQAEVISEVSDSEEGDSKRGKSEQRTTKMNVTEAKDAGMFLTQVRATPVRKQRGISRMQTFEA